ncbi:hypothetical protein ACFQT0_04185 [Hymenobacter humi]|uniref:Uncharacterized protein n=1 Tax=Hymenobacter humi TaxID=1411620 RepID=A0ABW2U087_9BACT
MRTLAALERETLTQLPSIATLAPSTPPAGNHAALLLNLRAERAELLRLQRRTDSTLLALGDLPGAPLPTVATVAPEAADTARVRPSGTAGACCWRPRPSKTPSPCKAPRATASPPCAATTKPAAPASIPR